MKISEVIAELEKIKQLSGDLDVVVLTDLYGTVTFDIEKNEWQCVRCGGYTPNNILSLVCIHCGVSCLYGPEHKEAEIRKDLTNG